MSERGVPVDHAEAGERPGLLRRLFGGGDLSREEASVLAEMEAATRQIEAMFADFDERLAAAHARLDGVLGDSRRAP